MGPRPGSTPFWRFPRRSAATVLAVVLACVLASHRPDARAASQCKLVRVAEWPVKLQRNLPIVEGTINGKKVGVLVDTGAYASLITKVSAEKLDLLTRATPEIMLGVGGSSQVLVTRIEELRIAGSASRNVRIRVGGERHIPGVDLILGDDFFRTLDVEFDYAKGVVRLFQPIDCKDAPLAYWDRNAFQLPLENENQIVLPVKINGRPARALLDSGASSSIVSAPFAQRVGVTPGAAETASAGCSGGLGSDLVRAWVGRFDLVEIGDLMVRDPRIKVMDTIPELAFGTYAMPEVLLGSDFLRAHRVLVSRSQRKIYFSYLGGQVFPFEPALECEEEPAGKDAAEARASYDQRIAQNPRDVDSLVRRAALRWREEGAKSAIEDLDAALRVDPKHAMALAMRTDARSAVRDFDGAFADSEAALANGVRTTRIYMSRGYIRRSQRDYPGAIEEYGRALEIDPRLAPALRARGRYLFHTGRFEAAEKDFASLLALRPHGINTIWLSMARERRGLDASNALKEGLARMPDGAWPAPVIEHLLGTLDFPALMRRATSPDEQVRKNQECEARYYAAARLVARSRAGEARPLLEKAAEECPRTFIEYDAAVIELERMN